MSSSSVATRQRRSLKQYLYIVIATLISISLLRNGQKASLLVPQTESSIQLPPEHQVIPEPFVPSELKPTQEDTPKQSHNSLSVSIWKYPVSSYETLNASRAVAMLSMGPSAAESTLLERCIMSIRKRGQFLDPILVLTDAPEERYEPLTRRDPNLVVLAPIQTDWEWELKRDMPYKRFKTFLLEYLSRDRRLAEVNLVYYLDIDIVVGQPLVPWFRHVEETYLRSDGVSHNSQMIMFDGNISPLQGGQFLVQANSSQGCLEKWRRTIDSNPTEHKDQVALTTMWEDQKKGSSDCHLVRMPQEPYLVFLSEKEMSQWKNGGDNYPTLMHIKNTQHAGVIPDALQKQFFQHLLDISPEVVVNVTGRKRIRPNRTWSALQVQGGN